MKTVVSGSEVFHMWANQTQDHARSGNGNVSFDGSELRSYNALIGEVVDRNGEKAWFISRNNYSVTTSRHISDAISAVPVKSAIFCVFDQWISPSALQPGRLAVGYERKITKVYGECLRSRSHSGSRMHWATDLIAEYHCCMHFFGMAIPDYAELITNMEMHVYKQAEKASQPKQAVKPVDLAKQLDSWKAGKRKTAPRTQYQYMRVQGGEIVTTLGARVAIADIKPYIQQILDGINRGIEISYGSNAGKIGPYRLTNISADGIVTVGCHDFKGDEIRRIAAILQELN